MPRHALFLVSLTLAFFSVSPAARAADPAADPAYRVVDIAPSRTSIFVGRVSISFSRFVRSDGVYAGDYQVRVFPFFYRESGHLRIQFNDEQIRRLHQGKTVTFVGEGRSRSGARRGVVGKATPEGLQSGRLLVDVFVTRSIKLVFHTTYRLEAAPES